MCPSSERTFNRSCVRNEPVNWRICGSWSAWISLRTNSCITFWSSIYTDKKKEQITRRSKFRHVYERIWSGMDSFFLILMIKFKKKIFFTFSIKSHWKRNVSLKKYYCTSCFTLYLFNFTSRISHFELVI